MLSAWVPCYRSFFLPFPCLPVATAITCATTVSLCTPVGLYPNVRLLKRGRLTCPNPFPGIRFVRLCGHWLQPCRFPGSPIPLGSPHNLECRPWVNFTRGPQGAYPHQAQPLQGCCLVTRIHLRAGVGALSLIRQVFRGGVFRSASMLFSDWFRRGHFAGVRVGEASNPGPQSKLTAFFGPAEGHSTPDDKTPAASNKASVCTFAVVNPTSILHKAQALREIGADVLILAETSAVHRVQTVTTTAMRQLQYKCLWGCPVPCHSRDSCPSGTLRGLAAGVALASRFPAHEARPPMSRAALDTCRLMDGFVRLGTLQIRVIVIYGYPLSHSDARERTNDLLQQAFDRACESAVPCIVAGDFNTVPFDLPAGQAFEQLGYQEVFRLHQQRTGQALPPTCKGSTRHDTALLHPALVPLWTSSWVLSGSHLFDSHDPLCFSLRSCRRSLCRRVWNLPRPWSDFSPKPDDFREAFLPEVAHLRRKVSVCSNEAAVGQLLEDFSAAAERAVSEALAKQHRQDPVRHPQASLPKRYRGRCKDRALIQRPLPTLLRPAWQGAYNPDVEVTSVLGKLKVRQVRRVQTLLAGLKKLNSSPHRPGPDQVQQLRNEWWAICRARGYPPDFPNCVLSVAYFNRFPTALPDVDWLSDLLSYLRYDADSLTRQQARCRRDAFLHRVRMDGQHASSRAGFQQMRPPAHPPFTEVPCQVQAEVSQLSEAADGTTVYTIPTFTNLRCPGDALLNSEPCHVIACTATTVTVKGEVLPVSGRLHQDFVACSPAELHRAFECFWCRLWQRDSASDRQDLRAWPDFCSQLEACGVPECQIHVSSFAPDLWAAAIRRMPVRKATGVCGWAPSDLKLLSPEAIEILCLIFQRAVQCGLPSHQLRARVCVLAKVALPDSIKQSRPITIFSTLYRIWASVLTRQVLQQWQPLFPDTVAGSMPRRACSDLTYRQLHQIERSLLRGEPLLGASVDLVKCFNQIPWPPAIAMARHAGVPAPELNFWLSCQGKLQRHSCFQGDLSEGLHSSNGTPEGDPFSVAIMAALCYVAVHIAKQPGLTCDTYVDNWAWSASCREPLASGLPKAFRFLESLRIPVDWSKSYCWATERSDRVWWKGDGQVAFLTDTRVECVTEAKDLGVAYCYDRLPHATLRDRRLSDALQRLDRLRDQPRPVCERASMVQRGVWPAVFYGCESHTLPQHQFETLRGRAARAIVGQYHILSPYLALTALTETVVDPQRFVAERQLLALRRAVLVDPDTAISVCEMAAEGSHRKRSCGPATALAITLHRAGVSLSCDGCVKGPDNTRLWLHTCRKLELRALVRRAWARKTAEAVSRRNGMTNLPPPHAVTTGKLLHRLSGSDQAIIARHVCGGFSSAAARAKWDPDEAAECPFCGANQTKYHKLFACPALQHVLAPVRDLVMYALERWPHWVHGPFAVEPPDLEVNRLIFHSRQLLQPPPLPACHETPGSRGFLRIFTDGSCCYPTMDLASRAGFAVVVDCSTSDFEIPGYMQRWRENGELPPCFHVHTMGLVPGEQSIHRAELCAVIQACRLAKWHGCAAEVWTDSQVTVEEWNRLDTSLLPMWPDLAHELGKARTPHIKLKKVAAHRDLHQLCGLPQWYAAGNAVADTAAKSTLKNDFELVCEASDRTAEFLQTQEDALLVFWRYLCRLSQEEYLLLQRLPSNEAQNCPTTLGDEEPPARVKTADETRRCWLQQCLTGGTDLHLPPAPRAVILACSWPPWYVQPFWHWTRRLKWLPDETSGRAKTGTTYLELLVSFVVCTGVYPPPSLQEAESRQECPRTFPNPASLRQLTHSLVSVADQVARLFGRPIWPAKRKKCFSLRALGVQQANRGVNMRLEFPEADLTADILHKVVRTNSVQTLQHHARDYTGPIVFSTELQKSWKQVTPTERRQLARSLRLTR